MLPYFGSLLGDIGIIICARLDQVSSTLWKDMASWNPVTNLALCRSKKQKLGNEGKPAGHQQRLQASPGAQRGFGGSAPAWNSHANGHPSMPWQTSPHTPLDWLKRTTLGQGGVLPIDWSRHHPHPVHPQDAQPFWNQREDVPGQGGQPPLARVGVPLWGQAPDRHAVGGYSQQGQQVPGQMQPPRGSSPPRRSGTKLGFVKRVNAARDTAAKSTAKGAI